MARHQTHILVQSSKLIKSLNSTSIATLLFTIDEQITYQTEMADRLGCTPAPISNALQSLEGLPFPLVEKNQKYRITQAGESIINLLDKHTLQRGIDICDIKWSDEREKEQLDGVFEPLHSARSSRPFFVLDVISRHNGQATIERVIEGVKDRRNDQNKPTSKKQIKRTIDWFETNDVVEQGEEIKLIDHGEDQAQLLCDCMDFIESLPDGGEDEGETETGYEETFIPAYRPSGSEDAIPLTSTTTIDELHQQIADVKRNHDGDETLNLVWMKEKQQVTV